MFHISFTNEIFKNSKSQKLSRGMFFIKNYIIKFLISENKNRTPDTYYNINNDYAMLKKFIKLTSYSTQNREKTQEIQKDKKTSFPKETVENVEPSQPVLNKIITTHQ